MSLLLSQSRCLPLRTQSSNSNALQPATRLDLFLLLVCLVIALGLRLAVISVRAEQLTVDRDAYLGIARSVAEGRGFSSPDSATPTAFRPPLYPISVAIGMLFLTPAIVVGGLNLISGLLAVWFTAGIGANLRLGRIGFVAAFLVAVDPLLLQYSAQPMTESLCTCLAAFWLWAATIDRASTKRWVRAKGFITGIAFGLLVLSRPTFWVVAGFCGLLWSFELIRNPKHSVIRKSVVTQGICAAIGTALMVAPWLIRNWLVFGVPILMTSHGGYTLLLGNNPVFYEQVVSQPWGTVWPDASQKEWEATLESEIVDAMGPQATELARDAWQSKLAKSYITAEPDHFAAAALHRIRSLWNTMPQSEAANGLNKTVLFTVDLFYRIELLLSVIGLILLLKRRQWSDWLPLFILIVSVQAVHLFYWTNTRMRAPLTPAIALIAVTVMRRKASEATL